MALKYCPNCGTEVIPPAKFCQNCGLKLEFSKSDCCNEEIPSFSKIEVGDTITFGKYIQNYDPEPIEWCVLDVKQGKALIISKYGLDMKPYHDKDADTNWEGSTIRWWLNGEFYHDSFTAQEKKLIIQSTIENKKRELLGLITDSNPTQDYVFLLSADESTYYFSISSDERTRKFGETKATPWAVKNGAVIYKVPFFNSYQSRWWLRTPGKYGNNCAAYYEVSTNRDGQLVSFQQTTVRPALWLKIESPKDTPEKESQSEKKKQTVNDLKIENPYKIENTQTSEIDEKLVFQDTGHENGILPNQLSERIDTKETSEEVENKNTVFTLHENNTSFDSSEQVHCSEVFDEPIEIVIHKNESTNSISLGKEKILDNSDLSQETQKNSDSITETISNDVNSSELSGSSSDQKAIWIQNQASEVSQSGLASAYFFFDLRNELNLGNYDWQKDEFLKAYSKYFPDMTMDDLQQLSAQAIPWLNDPNTCNSQYQIIMQDSFEHRFIMIANAWFERALCFESTQRVQFVYNTCASFFYPQELQTVWQRLQCLQQTTVNQVRNMNDSFDISCFMNIIQRLPNAIEIAEYVQSFNIQNPGIFDNEIIDQLSKSAYLEKMYGNAKREAIRKISNYFGITYHENSALQYSEINQSKQSTENSSSDIGEKTNIKKDEEKVTIISNRNNNSKNSSSSLGAILFLIIFAFVLYSCTTSWGTSSSSSTTRQCGFCHRTFSDATNKNYILHTNLCRNCYRTMCFANGMTPKNYDK